MAWTSSFSKFAFLVFRFAYPCVSRSDRLEFTQVCPYSFEVVICISKPGMHSRSVRSCDGPIADQEESDIVSLACSASEILDRFKNGFLEMIQWSILLAGEDSAKAGNPEHLFIGIHGFSNAIAKEY